LSNQSNRARALIQAKLFDEAVSLLERSIEASPDMWWLRMELARAQRRGRFAFDQTCPHRLFFSPHYSSNHYQSLLHAHLHSAGVVIQAVEVAELLKLKNTVLSEDGACVFHQHWLKEIYRGLRADRHGYDQIDRYFAQLRLFRSLGGKVLWTVHNLFDHDLGSDDRALNHYCLRLIARLADRILVHGPESIPLVEQACGFEVGYKCSLLHHPLYDSINSPMPVCPSEMRAYRVPAGLTYLCFGLIRPYKGGGDLLQRYLGALQAGKLLNTRLIFAGLVQDRNLLREIDHLPLEIRRHVVLINRRVDDAELSWLCAHADVAVLPYRNILTSGSFYQATTHALPCIVPASGMFESVIEDGVNGLLYANEADLAATLIRANTLGKSHLRKIGHTALQRCQNHSASGLVAERYQTLFQSLFLRNSLADV